MSYRLNCFGLTDVGAHRPANQDHFLVADLNKAMRIRQSSLNFEDGASIYGDVQGELLLVADGMGGTSDGELASRVTVATLAEYMLNSMPWFFSLEGNYEGDFDAELQAAVDQCQQRMLEAAHRSPRSLGMGTTLTCGYVVWPQLYLAHVGDSRAYLLRGRRLDCLTTDHTVAQQLGLDQLWDRAAVENSRFSHTLWNCLTTEEGAAHPDLRRIRLQPGDVLLFCTDGLVRYVDEAVILETLLRQPDGVEDAARELVDLANARGGRDNITVVVGRFSADDRPPPEAAPESAEQLMDTVVEVDLRQG